MRAPGFTLVEVVVALVVLQIAVLAALATLAVAVRTGAQSARVEERWHAIEWVADSLRVAPNVLRDRRVVGVDTLSWVPVGDSAVIVRGTGSGWVDSVIVWREVWHGRP